MSGVINQERAEYTKNLAQWYIVQTQCTDLLRAGFSPTVIAYELKIKTGRINRLVRSLKKDPYFVEQIPALNPEFREYKFITKLSLKSVQDRADASLFALIYSNITKRNIYEEVDIWAVVDAYRIFLQEIAPRTAQQSVLQSVNRAWNIANSFVIGTGEFDICPLCGEKYYIKLSGPVQKKCPSCCQKKNPGYYAEMTDQPREKIPSSINDDMAAGNKKGQAASGLSPEKAFRKAG